MNLAFRCRNQQLFNTAITGLQNSLRIASNINDQANTLLQIGNAFFTRNQKTDAEKIYLDAYDLIMKHPSNNSLTAELLNKLGNCLKKITYEEKAIDCYQLAIKLEKKAIYQLNLGIAYLSLKDNNAAIKTFIETINLISLTDHTQENLDLANKLGKYLYNLECYKETLICYQLANKLEPHKPNHINNIGLTLYKLGNKQDALEHFNQALILAVDSNDKANILVNRGDLFLVLGEKEKAYQDYKIANQLTPTDDMITQKLNDLIKEMPIIKNGEDNQSTVTQIQNTKSNNLTL